MTPVPPKWIAYLSGKMVALAGVLVLAISPGTVKAGQEGTLIARDILVVTGISEITGEERWPADSAAAKSFQMVLEYMGYELRFRKATDLAREGFRPLEPSFAGIILEGNIHLPVEEEGDFVDWIGSVKSAGQKVLMIDSIPVRDYIEKQRLARIFGMSAKYTELKNPEEVRFAKLDKEMMDYEFPTRPFKEEIADIRAPADAELYLSVVASGGGTEVQFDPVFTAPWGGAILSPYGYFQASDRCSLSYVDTFKFLAKIWPEGIFPAPDVTTRDGLRSVFFHIDGDGFTSLSHSKRGLSSGKIIMDQFLKKYPFPVTVSIVEADIRVLQVGLRDEDENRFKEEAREIFALPHVEAASHTFSHPFIWMDDDQEEYGEEYEARFLNLKPRAEYAEINYEREVSGSVDYIENELLPEGKKVEVLLWSGNCRPGPKALAAVRDRGIVSLNGGDTFISKRDPGISGVAPRITYWDDEIQVYAPNQNDYVYTNNWEGPVYSGFAQAVETFELTESPRRLKPVNVYYHFYSGVQLSSLFALSKVYQWCVAQPLHSITAATYARIAKDSHLTKIFRIADKHWRVVNEGHLRTFRIPAKLGYPDLAKSSGVTGFNDEGEWRYIHTSGQPESEIVLGMDLPKHLYLESSSAEIGISELEQESLRFVATDVREIQVVLGGAEPSSEYQMEVNGTAQVLTSGPDGRIRLDLPKNSVVWLGKMTPEIEIRPATPTGR